MLRLCIAALLVAYASGSHSWSDCDRACDGGQRVDSTWGGTMVCNNFPCVCPTSCACGAFDIVIVMDNSGSIGETNFWKQKQFVIDLVKGLESCGADPASRVSMVGFNAVGYIEFDFAAGYGFHDMSTLVDQIWDMDYTGGWTNIAAGLFYAEQIMTGQALGNHIQLVMVLTDGHSNRDTNLLEPNANALHQNGASVYGIGIGNVNNAELTTISSQPTSEFYFYVTNYDALTAIVTNLMDGTCCNTPPPTCVTVSESACSQTCGGGVITVEEACTHYNYAGAVVSVDTVQTTRPCTPITCATSCWYDGVEHQPGSVWEEETCADHFLECTCPQTLPAGVTVWNEDDYCQGVCYVAGVRYTEGQTWNVTAAGVSSECKCEADGEPLCTALEICRYHHQDYAAGSSWVIDVSGGRQKRCYCPDSPPTHDLWTVTSYCTAFCDDGGVIYQPGDTWMANRNGAEFDCRCNDYGVARCKETKPCGCVYHQVTHARGATWIQEVSAGRHKECTCPLTGDFSVDLHCVVICVVSGNIHRPENNGVFQMYDPLTQCDLDCRCNQHGNIRCDNVCDDVFDGCRAFGTLYPPGQTFILDVSGGRRKECVCPATMAPGCVWTIRQYCKAICVVDGITHYGSDSFTMTDSCTGDPLSCVCKSYGVVKC